GIQVEGGSVNGDLTGSPAAFHIHNNGGHGLDFTATFFNISGPLHVDSNSSGDGFQVAVAVMGGSFDGVQISGGVKVVGNAIVAFGSNVTITGGVSYQIGSIGVVAGASTIDAFTCDATSWVYNGATSTIGSSTCPPNGPSGSQ